MFTKAIGFAAFCALQPVHRRLSLRKDRVFFFSDVRDKIGGNLRVVYETLDDNSWDKVIWCNDKHMHPQNIKSIKEISRALNTSRYIFLEDVMPFLEFYKPKQGQEIIQLWHAAGAYKKFGFSRIEEDLRVSKGHNKYTKAITSSDYINALYAEAYGISVDKIIATGVPRTDIFFDDEWRTRVKEQFLDKYPKAKDKKVILFAPTYRGTKIGDAGYDMTKLPFDYLRDELIDDYLLVTKWHPAMYKNLEREMTYDDKDFLIDMSYIRDINDILPIADILITDYSSVIFEWSLLDRPVIYYVHDESEYESMRGLYFPFSEYVYGEITKNPEELVKAIKNSTVNEDERIKFIDKFMKKCDGNATARVAKLIEGEH